MIQYIKNENCVVSGWPQQTISTTRSSPWRGGRPTTNLSSLGGGVSAPKVTRPRGPFPATPIALQLHFIQCSFPKPNSDWFGKVTPDNCVQFFKPIPVWFGKKKN